MEPAKNLREAYQAADPRPLPSGDDYFVDLTKARASDATGRMKLMIENCAEAKCASIAFSGHRGSGKSTELHRLEKDLSGSCFTLYLAVDDFLDASDVEYTDLFLLIARRLIEKLIEENVSISPSLLKAVEGWFQTITKETEETVKLSSGISTEVRAGVELPFIARLLAKLTADIKAGSSNKTSTRTELDRYFSGLLANINLLLNEAARALHDAGKPSKILILVDNLDRMPPKKSEELIFAHGSQLQDLNCHAVFTVSIEMFYSPRSIATVFPLNKMLPNVKLREGKSNANPYEPGISALHQIVGKRWSERHLLADASISKEIIRLSGGSVTQLVALMREAVLSAQGRSLTVVDTEAVQDASTSVQQDFERSLFPNDYALLAKTAARHTILRTEEYLRLLWTRAILEYNGNEIWHNVNPLIESIHEFQAAKNPLRHRAPRGGRVKRA